MMMAWLETLAKDVILSFRSVVKNPGFTIIAILTLGLGIGANTAIFSAVNSILLNRLPFRDSAQLVTVWLSNKRLVNSLEVTSFPNYQDWKHNRVLTDIALFVPFGANIAGEGAPQQIPAAFVSANFLAVLGVKPDIGRSFLAREEQAGEDGVVLLSNSLWRQRFGADPNVLGRSLRVRGSMRSIVGVLPPGFDFPERAQVWIPLVPTQSDREGRGNRWLRTVARLKPGVSLDQAQAEMGAIGTRLAQEYPDFLHEHGVVVRPIREYMVGDIRPALLVLLGSVALVLLIACVNVANLLLARATVRAQEMAVRFASGANRRRVIRQLLTESVVLAGLGGFVGLALATLGLKLVRSANLSVLRNVAPLSLDGRVLAFTLAISIATGVLFGLAPVLQVSHPNLSESLRDRGRSGSGKRHRFALKLLVMSEIGLAFVLVLVASSFVESFTRMMRADPGFNPERVLTVSVALTTADYPEPSRGVEFYRRLLERIRALPDVQSAGAISTVLLPEVANAERIDVEGIPNPTPAQRVLVTKDSVTAGFFRTLGIAVLRGRSFTAQDDEQPGQNAVINKTMADRFWSDQDPIGKRFKFGAADDPDVPWLTVVGVVSDPRRGSMEREEPPSCFLPHRQLPENSMTVVVRTRGAVRPALAQEIVAQAHALDPVQPVTRIATLGELMEERLAVRRSSTLLLTAFSILALGLASVGIYGVISYFVTQSLRDIGIRLALGAQSGQVLRMILGNGLILTLTGILFGLGGAFAAGRWISSLLVGVSASDPVRFLVLALFVVLLASAASFFPARRASRTDPILVLRAG